MLRALFSLSCLLAWSLSVVSAMDKIKTILTLVAVILVALVVLAGIGFIYTFLSFLLILGIVCLGAVIAFRFLRGSNRGQVHAADPHQELKKVERLLDEYKRK